MVVPRPPSAPSCPSSYCSPHIFKLIDHLVHQLSRILPRFSTLRNVYSIPCNANFCFSHYSRLFHPQVNGAQLQLSKSKIHSSRRRGKPSTRTREVLIDSRDPSHQASCFVSLVSTTLVVFAFALVFGANLTPFPRRSYLSKVLVAKNGPDRAEIAQWPALLALLASLALPYIHVDYCSHSFTNTTQNFTSHQSVYSLIVLLPHFIALLAKLVISRLPQIALVWTSKF